MAATDSKAKADLGFAISYGLAGGPRHSRQLTKLLKLAGFSPKSLAEADIVIAHSAGSWLIPGSVKPKMVIYIGMPLATASPRRTWLAANKASFQGSFWQNLGVRSNNMYYYLRQPRRNFKIMRDVKAAAPVIFPEAQAVFIANRHDPWPMSDSLRSYLDQDWAFISLPGTHDDIWEHPGQYVDIINHYARLLA